MQKYSVYYFSNDSKQVADSKATKLEPHPKEFEWTRDKTLEYFLKSPICNGANAFKLATKYVAKSRKDADEYIAGLSSVKSVVVRCMEKPTGWSIASPFSFESVERRKYLETFDICHRRCSFTVSTEKKQAPLELGVVPYYRDLDCIGEKSVAYSEDRPRDYEYPSSVKTFETRKTPHGLLVKQFSFYRGTTTNYDYEVEDYGNDPESDYECFEKRLDISLHASTGKIWMSFTLPAGKLLDTEIGYTYSCGPTFLGSRGQTTDFLIGDAAPTVADFARVYKETLTWAADSIKSQGLDTVNYSGLGFD